MNGLTPTQHEQLLKSLDPGRVSKLRGMSHIEAWDVRRWLIRIFGFTGWSFEVVETALVYQNIVPSGEKLKATVVYRATGRLRIRDEAGNELAVFEDAATGDGVNMPSVGDAHDFALKTAVSQSLKRCAANLGDQFGLSLYNDGSIKPVVERVLARTGEAPVTLPVDPPVVPSAEAAEPPMERPRPDSPVDDEWTLPPPVPGVPRASEAQLQKLGILLTQKRGLSSSKADRPARLAAVQAMVHRTDTLTSSKDLSKSEASSLIETLTAEPDHAPLPDNPVRDILAGGIAAANSPGALDEAGRDVTNELTRGSITPGEAEHLRGQWRSRKGQLQAEHAQMAGATA